MRCEWCCLAEALTSHIEILPTNSRFILKQKEEKSLVLLVTYSASDNHMLNISEAAWWYIL